MGLQLLTAAGTQPIELVEAKEHLRVEDDVTEDDALIGALITAATANAEHYLNRSLIQRTWQLSLDAFPGYRSPMHLPEGKIQSVTAIRYYDRQAVLTTLPIADYQYDLSPDARARIAPAPSLSWPDTELERMAAVEVEFIAGYGTTAPSIPKDIILGIKLILGHAYENRETVIVGITAMELPMGAQAILAPHRLIPV